MAWASLLLAKPRAEGLEAVLATNPGPAWPLDQ
jgi:hypothetical protein